MQVVIRWVMAVAVMATLMGLLPRAARAQQPVEIKYHARVRGYSDWVRIDTGSRSGGRVIREPGGGLVTDRVARGETLRVSIDDRSFTRKCKCSFLLEARITSENRSVLDGIISIPFQREFTLPVDPNFDNVFVTVFDPIAPGGKVTRRIPIGSR